MKRLFFLLPLLAFLACNSTEKEVIYFDDFITAEQGNDHTQSAIRLVEYLTQRQDTTPLVVQFSKKAYHFQPEGAFEKEVYISNHDQSNPKKIGFYLSQLRNVHFQGDSTSFIFSGRMLPVFLTQSQNVTFSHIAIDFDLPHLRQLEVLELDPASDEMLVKIYPEGHYKIAQHQLILTGQGYEYTPFTAMVFRADRRLAYQRADIAFNPQSVEEVSPNTFKIKGWEQIALSEKGERFALRSYYRPTPGIVVDFCKNTLFKDVKVHYAEGMGLLAQMSENIHLNGFSVCLKGDDDPRYFTTQADATHFSSCKGWIRSENGLYEGMADDAINVHGTYLKVIKRIDQQTLQAQYMHPQAWGFQWGEVGNKVQFIASKTMEAVAEGKNFVISSIKAVDKPTFKGAKIYEIAFTEPLPTVISANDYSIENLSYTPEVVFSHNLIRNNRARGTLFSTPKSVLCENNTFDHTHGAAILLAGDSNGWYETGQCKEVIIRNNHFINALTANYQFTNAIISIYPEIPHLKEQKTFFHSNILIEKNIFETFDTPILYAKSVNGLTFRDNDIRYNQEFAPFHWNKYLFLFDKVANVKIENNHFPAHIKLKKGIKVNLSASDAVVIK